MKTTKNTLFSNCVAPGGKFIFGLHKPAYTVANLRQNTAIESLGELTDGSEVNNRANFPAENVTVNHADWIYEIANPLSFRGTTYIDKDWADASANDYSRIHLPKPETLSFSQILKTHEISSDLLSDLPQALLLTLATCSTDPEDLEKIVAKSCALSFDNDDNITGLKYSKDENGRIKPIIFDHDLFEAVANNPHLPDHIKIAMVLRPGAQGSSEIVGDVTDGNDVRVYEYLRKNSYIAGGHYAANMSDQAVRYSINSLEEKDIRALRHLYYQRTYHRLAGKFEISVGTQGKTFSADELEALRLEIVEKIGTKNIDLDATLWGWNFGFDYTPTNYRLHASHQQIHQQYAMVPDKVEAYSGNIATQVGEMQAFSSGDMITKVIADYQNFHSSDFFSDYLAALSNNSRMDNRHDLGSQLIVWQDDNVILFVPKAQTSQWELQVMTLPDTKGNFIGNILETNNDCRDSIDGAILKAQQIFERLGAKMVTTIEYSKRISQMNQHNQPLLYSFLPKLPQSPGAFSEAQLRYINGHYPEDFAAVCKAQL